MGEKQKNETETIKTDEVLQKSNKFLNIDKKTLPYKLNFFLYIGAMGSLLPFHPSIGITRLGLGASNLAVVFTVQQFLFIVLKPIIGYIVDYFNNLKFMIFFLTVLNAILSYLLLAIPPVDNPNLKNWKGPQQSEINLCNLCQNLNDLQEISLPNNFNDLEKKLFCKNKTNATNYRVLLHNCFDASPNTSHDKFEVIVTLCSTVTFSVLTEQKSSNEFDPYKNFETVVLFIKISPNRTTTGDIIACPNVTGIFEVENFNVGISKSCYRAAISNIPSINALDQFNHLEKDVTCNESYPENPGTDKILEAYNFKTYQFWLFTILIWISCTCTSCIFTLSDTACYESLQHTGGDYGKQRAWGSVGWGLIAPLAGFLNDYTDSYLAAMILMTFLCALQLWNLSKMDLIKPQLSQNILKDIRNIFKSLEFLAFELAVLMNGMGIGIVWFFLAWFITDIGGSRLLIGLAHTVQCFLGEMPFMIISGWLLKKVGHFNLVSLALFSHFIRFLGYSYLKNPWHILPLECLDGITFGVFYTAMTSYGKLSAKPGTEATTQSLLCSTYEGLGAGLGCVISGICFDHYGGHTTFFYASLCFAAATAINITSTLLLHCRKRRVLEICKSKEADFVKY